MLCYASTPSILYHRCLRKERSLLKIEKVFHQNRKAKATFGAELTYKETFFLVLFKDMMEIVSRTIKNDKEQIMYLGWPYNRHLTRSMTPAPEVSSLGTTSQSTAAETGLLSILLASQNIWSIKVYLLTIFPQKQKEIGRL